MADLVKVKFIKSPTGKFRMAYNAGHSGLVHKELADKLIKEGYAVLVDAPTKKVETKTSSEAESATTQAKNEQLVKPSNGIF